MRKFSLPILLLPCTPEGRKALRDEMDYQQRTGNPHPGSAAATDWDDIAIGNAEAFAEFASWTAFCDNWDRTHGGRKP